MSLEDGGEIKVTGRPWIVPVLVTSALVLAWLVYAGRTTTAPAGAVRAPGAEPSGTSQRPDARDLDPPYGSKGADRSNLSTVRVGGDVTRPVKTSGSNPQYTVMARKGRIQGVVILEAVIDKNGSVVDVRVLKPLPMGLDQAAVDAVREWKFRPAMRKGEPVAVSYNLTVSYHLE